MSITGRAPAQRARREWVALLSLALVLAALLVSARWRGHQDIETAEREQLAHQVASMEGLLSVQLASALNAMRDVREQIPGWPPGDRADEANRQFRIIGTAHAGLDDLQWLDAAGRVAASSRDALLGANMAERRSFSLARARHDPAMLVVSEPFRTPSGANAIDLAIAIAASDGAFAGAITATLNPSYFRTVLASALYAPDMRALIVHGNGAALAFLPPAANGEGVDLSKGATLFKRYRESGAEAMVLAGPLLEGGAQRIVAYHRLQPPALAMDEPLVLAVSRRADAVFADWQKNSLAYAGLYGASLAAAAILLVAFQRRRAEDDRHDAARQAQKAADDERLELALQGADLALWDLHLPSGRIAVSERWYSMLGEPPGATLTRSDDWAARIHPDDRQRVQKARDDNIDGLTPGFDIVFRQRHAQGRWIWIVDRGRVVERDAGGGAVRMVGTNFDATERIEAQEALRRSEQDLATTLQSIGDGVIATDTTGAVTRLNAAAEALTGWRAADAVGAPLASVFRIVDAQTRVALDDPVGRVLALGAPVELGETALLIARDGQERAIADSAAPIRDGAGRIAGVVIVFSDVSRHRAAVAALQDSEHQLLTLTAAMPGPVARFDRDGRYLFTNATCERWFGDPPAKRLGRRWGDVFPSTVVSLLAPHMTAALAGEAATFDMKLPTQDGERDAMVSIVPDRDADGAVQGTIVVLTDVTARKRAEEALRQSEERSRALLAALRSGVVVHAPDMTIVSANPSACRILGTPCDTLIGQPGDDTAWHYFEEDGRELPTSAVPVRRVHAGGEPVHDQVIGVRRRAGTGPVVWLLCSAFPVREPGGALQQIVVTFADLTEHKQAQERLRRSEEELRMASRLARLGGWRYDVATGHIGLAPDLVELIGPGTEPAAGFVPVLAEADRRRWDARLRLAIADGLPIDEEYTATAAPGRTAHWRVLGEAVRDAAGAVVAVQGALQDVTDVRQAQQQLRLLEAAVAGLNDAVLITAAAPIDEPGPRTIFVNPAFERMTGFDLAEMLGRSPRKLQGPRTPGSELDRLREAIRTCQPAHVELVNYRRDGKLYWVEISMVPLVDAAGRTTHFVAVQRDITERKQAAAAVEAAQRELAATLEAVPDLLFDVDLEGRVHQCHAPANASAPIDPAQVVGRRIDEVFPRDVAATIMTALTEARARGHSAGLQYELVSRVGRQSFELSVSGKPVPAGEPPRFIVLARDVTERRLYESQRHLLERQLREAQKMESIGTLAGGIAHDFNNILAAILGNLALARDDIAADHPAQPTLDQIAKASMRARSLVQQILTFSRRQPNPLRPRALRPIVEETLGLLRATLPAAVRLGSRLVDEELVVSADATQLQQVLMNLCTNAWQALPEGRGRIEVGLEALDADVRIAELAEGGPWAHLWVADDGAGMDAMTRERIFDPFFTTKPVGQGTGLGLSVVHGIVRGHHGTVAVETAIGAGSTFHLYFPLVADGRDADSALTPLAATPAAALRDAAGGGEHLLYVDDDEVMVLMVQRLLRRDGYRVTSCGSAVEALGMVDRPNHGFDLVVSDFNMPEMSGLELAERLRALRPALPMVLTSGYLTDDVRDQARALGVRALLQKERTLEELGGIVQHVLQGATLI